MLTELAREKGLDLVVTCHPDVPALLTGDPTRLAQVITNLVANAVKFTDQGEVAVRATAEPEGERVRRRVDVADTGVGVPVSKQAQLFQPFTQGDSSTTRIYGGTGLGLAISSELVDAMGGTLAYAANPGGGSVFTCTVVLDQGTVSVAAGPGDVLARELPEDRRTLPVADEPTGRGRILVVEDNPVNQLVATGLLTALGYTCDTANDGLAAIEAARDRDFDAILMDVQMPQMDGYTATRHIRAHETGRRRPIIAMTAAAIAGERERCLEAGMDDFLTNPVDANRLADTLRRWLVPAPWYAERLDLERLEELRGLDDPEDGSSYVDRAIANFLGGADGHLASMEAAAAAGDAAQLRAVTHRLAGSALNLGAVALGEAARELEEQVADGSWDDAVAALPGLADRMATDLAALRAYQREQFPARASS
jgi:CheY-like chemotaxis protein/HPt (histidine-containing phosphotransfer) domain-containing protein